MARVLVTGGAGFIGSHLVRALHERGDTVRVLDNFITGRRENLSGLRGRLEVLEGDLRDLKRLNEAVQDVEVVFHLAAFVSVPESTKDPETCFAVNVAGTVNLLETARKTGVRKVVLASSTAVYGNCDTLPIQEDASLRPLSPYAVSKQVNELYARFYTQTLGLPVIPLRFFNVYGPRQNPDSDYAAAIPILLDRLLHGKPVTVFGDGRQTRDFIFIADVVQANLLAAESEAAGEAFNICTGQEITILDLLEIMEEIAPGRPRLEFIPPRPGDIYRSVGNPEKAFVMLGFRAKTSLVDGLRETIEWMKN